MENRIFHLDMDCYFASVEIMLNPSLENIPICVGGRFMNGVVSSANYVARKQGVKSAMPLFEAKKICPSLQILSCNHDLYEEYSNKIHTLLLTIVKKVEKASIDEWFIDVTDSEYETWDEIEFATYLKNLIYKKFKLKCSIGNSFTMFLAKTATDLCKPDGYLTLNKNNFKKYLYNVPLSDIYGVGKTTLKTLNEFHIRTVEDIINIKNEIFIKKKLGVFWSKLKYNVLGIELSKVNPYVERKNIGKSYTVKNFTEYDEYYKLLMKICNDINLSLQKHDYLINSFTLRIKLVNKTYLGETFNYYKYVNKFEFNDLIGIFDKYIDESNYGNIKNIAVTVLNLINKDKYIEQKSLFDIDLKREETPIEIIVSKVNKKLNKKIIYPIAEKAKS